MGFASSSVSSASFRALLFCVYLFTAIAATEARPDFDKCFGEFITNHTKNGTYTGDASIIYQGLTYNHYKPNATEREFLVSTEGCRTLCGKGPQYYQWSQIAGTITTWVLPIIGLLLQAPYESNAFRRTLYAIARWLGSPIASLSYTLWNIKIIGKCALLSDMSTSFGVKFDESRLEDAEPTHDEQDMLDMRDSLYILSVMNQYTIKSPVDLEQAETLLRVALFADITIPTLDLKERRRNLALSLREGRKRGTVPVFVTLMWFLFSLAISIEGAFSDVGYNYNAHDVALGLLLAWLPVLILSSIVDRNPTQTTTYGGKLNKLLKEVQVGLRTDEGHEAADQLKQAASEKKAPIFTLVWVGSQTAEVPFDQESPPPLALDFFNEFAGQGRVRWHHGVAYPILTGMETIILDKTTNPRNPRDWLKVPDIQKDLVCGPEENSLLLHFDLREFWEILSALTVVIGTISGAFIVSFRTPKIGLGCRSGGYAVFGIIATGIFLLELLSWYFVVAPTGKTSDRIGGQNTDKSRKQGRKEGQKLIAALNWIFCICEITNTVWLIYIVMAQTLGSYQTCGCQSANWSFDGGYINAKLAQHADRQIVERWWIIGVLLSSLTMLAAIAFLVVEWCEQSHLNTIELSKAKHGLKKTQHFKHRTLWIRRPFGHFIDLSKSLWCTFRKLLWNTGEMGEKETKSIRWSK